MSLKIGLHTGQHLRCGKVVGELLCLLSNALDALIVLVIEEHLEFTAALYQVEPWRERAELRLESADFAALSNLTGQMLETLKMAGMDFSIAAPTRKSHEDALLKDAVEAFKARAQLATQALGGSGYKLVSLNLNSGGFQPPMPMRMAKGMAMMEAAPTPEIEAGTSQVTINADGVIEVQMP